MTNEELIDLRMEQRPHVVILGAGASRAAFPDGDGNGRQIPVMNDLVKLIDLGELLQSTGLEWRDRNFEEVYANLRSDDTYQKVADTVEDKVRIYFAEMQLPGQACLYDHLLLSLRSKDAIATFNWDPFLMDAYRRNVHVRELPHMLFLHGCVRAGLCPVHRKTAGSVILAPTVRSHWSRYHSSFRLNKRNIWIMVSLRHSGTCLKAICKMPSF